eukprot:Em0431g2a
MFDLSGELLFNKWYLDDGVLAGTSLSVRAALDVISSLGPSLGLYINFAKCEVFGKAELSAFPSEITKRYHTPQLEILGAPIGNEEFCNNFVINKQSSVSFLLQQLQGLENPQLALALLRKCAAFCKMTHISRVTPPTLIKSSLSEFDDSIHHCFTECLALNLSPQSSGWKQACLSLSRGGLGLRSVAVHSTAAYLGSVSSSSPDLASSHYVIDALNLFNLQVSAEDTSQPPPIASVGAGPLHASGQQLATENNVTNGGSKYFKDLGKPAAFDLSVTSTLYPSVLLEASMTADSAALVAENRKYKYNDRKCEELGWVCIPLVVETYGCWGAAAVAAFSKLAGRLSTRLNQTKSKTIFGIYSRLGLALVLKQEVVWGMKDIEHGQLTSLSLIGIWANQQL